MKKAAGVDATKAIKALADDCAKNGVSIICGPGGTVKDFWIEGDNIIGVRLVSRQVQKSDFLVLATGAWTESLIPSQDRLLATGQPLGFIKLTPCEQEEFANYPVCIELTRWILHPTADTGWLP